MKYIVTLTSLALLVRRLTTMCETHWTRYILHLRICLDFSPAAALIWPIVGHRPNSCSFITRYLPFIDTALLFIVRLLPICPPVKPEVLASIHRLYSRQNTFGDVIMGIGETLVRLHVNRDNWMDPHRRLGRKMTILATSSKEETQQPYCEGWRVIRRVH